MRPIPDFEKFLLGDADLIFLASNSTLGVLGQAHAVALAAARRTLVHHCHRRSRLRWWASSDSTRGPSPRIGAGRRGRQPFESVSTVVELTAATASIKLTLLPYISYCCCMSTAVIDLPERAEVTTEQVAKVVAGIVVNRPRPASVTGSCRL